ncbi:hypothetical protein HDU87_001612 [Geranomyces variabilis]|uniref:DUF4097 domain-containing protein n=1 Tax=Geranomyces variabilis TaxID=109894 RepID=A0AAD5TMJ0_9FUNG|nr:hypothetical protein HDU87_001612 [Geranomyces variabilis]
MKGSAAFDPLLLPAAAAAAPAVPARTFSTTKAVFLAVGTLLALAYLAHTEMLAGLFRSSWKGDGASQLCGGKHEFEYRPEPGHWDSAPQPSNVEVALTGLASGEVVVVATSEAKIATTSVVFYLSDLKLAEKITIKQEPNQDGRYKLVIDTPKVLRGQECIRADVRLALPAQQEPKISAAVSADNARVTLQDMRGGVMFNTVDASSKNGRVEARGLDAQGAVHISSYNGAVQAAGITAATFTIESKNGRVVVSDSTVSDAAGFIARSANGGIELRHLHVTTLDTNTANGRTELTDVRVSSADGATVVGHNGAISGDIALADPAAALSATTSTGRVELVVNGNPKTIAASSKTGRVSLRIANDKFSGAFDARSKLGGVEVSGSDVHFTGDARSRSVKTGWRGAEDGGQSVTAETVTGRVSLQFA